MKKEKKVPSKPKCEVGTFVGCNGQGVMRLTGKKKGDPKFWCCIGCRAILNRNGVKTKEATE